ncbi:hypothetical protein J2S00_000374 [Caldalkalibacillus uzonensis]|uniref:DUF4062 domain-containing protein n=2 Tax=Caldalkalibacillus uzonensis TaxID=353224 RepID=A0ABU0CMH3_9BACI|nr:hypothetical protein [Caldalkalibacillus uzonensis]
MSESIRFDWTREDIIKSCLQEVENSDVYVLLIGKYFGSQVKEGLSITQAEYHQAKAKKKPIFIVILNETWVLYQQAPQKLDQEFYKFISEVSSNFRHYVKTFSNSEEAFNYIRAQLSHLLKGYLELQLPAREIHDIINRGKRFQSYFRFAISLIENQTDYNRIIAAFTQELESGDINNQDFIPQPIIRLSKATGATLYRSADHGEELIKVGSTGDVGGRTAYNLNDHSSYVSVTFQSQESKLFEKETAAGEKENILCIPIAKQFILTLHFLVEQEYQKRYDENLILEEIYNKNKVLFNTFNLFFAKGENDEG